MWDLVGNPEDRFSHNEAHILWVLTRIAPAVMLSKKRNMKKIFLKFSSGKSFVQSCQRKGMPERSNLPFMP